MSTIITKISEINSLIDNNEFVEAHNKLYELIIFTSVEEMKINIGQIEDAINRFYPKRRRDLSIKLNDKLGFRETAKAFTNNNKKKYSIIDLQRALHAELTRLSEHHIFQWSTYYRDYFNKLLKELTAIVLAYNNKDEIVDCVANQISLHSNEIFKKGYDYSTGSNVTIADIQTYAIYKSLGGFIAVP